MSDDIREVARKRLKAKSDFKVFLGVAIIVSAILVVIWLVTSGFPTDFTGYFWPMWPLLGLAIALAFSGYHAYGPGGHVTESDIDAEVERLKRKSGGA